MLDVQLLQSQTFLPLPYEAALFPRLKRSREKLESRGGWVRLPERRESLAAWLRETAAQIRVHSQVLAVLGAGPGPQGLAECLLPRRLTADPRLLFLGGGDEEILPLLEEADFSVAVMPAGAEDPFLRRLNQALRSLLVRRYGTAEGRWITFSETWGDLPQGGWDLLGPGLLPAVFAGADAEALLAGAAEMMARCESDSFENPAWRYAAIRHQLYRSGRTVEVLAGWGNASLGGLLAWRQRLAAGSEGKEGKGLFPAWALYPRDLPTLGQALREGKQPVLETVLAFAGDKPAEEMEDLLLAHGADGLPVILLETGALSPETLGGLIYFFQYACALSCGLLDVDPFQRAPSSPDAGAERPLRLRLAGKL